MKVLLREYPKTGANGDRDTGPGVPYSDYKVVLVNDGGEEVVSSEISGYDSMWSAPRDRTAVFDEAAKAARAMADFFKTEVEGVKMTRKVYPEVWVPA